MKITVKFKQKDKYESALPAFTEYVQQPDDTDLKNNEFSFDYIPVDEEPRRAMYSERPSLTSYEEEMYQTDKWEWEKHIEKEIEAWEYDITKNLQDLGFEYEKDYTINNDIPWV